jgi:hypothetical protein
MVPGNIQNCTRRKPQPNLTQTSNITTEKHYERQTTHLTNPAGIPEGYHRHGCNLGLADDYSFVGSRRERTDAS